MAQNDTVSARASKTHSKVVIHRVRPNGQRALVGYYSPDEAEDIGLRIIREAGKLRERLDTKTKLKAA